MNTLDSMEGLTRLQLTRIRPINPRTKAFVIQFTYVTLLHLRLLQLYQLLTSLFWTTGLFEHLLVEQNIVNFSSRRLNVLIRSALTSIPIAMVMKCLPRMICRRNNYSSNAHRLLLRFQRQLRFLRLISRHRSEATERPSTLITIQRL